MSQFVECDSCAEKPGTPILCGGCVHNRKMIAAIEKQVEGLKKQISARDDEAILEETKRELIRHLKQKGALLSPRNMVHAMYDMHCADFLGGTDTTPTCEYEK